MEGRDNDDVDMDLLVDDAPNDNKDFVAGAGKDLSKPQTDQERDDAEVKDGSGIVSNENWDIVGGTESFIHRRFGLSAEDIEEGAAEVEAEGNEIGEANIAAAAGVGSEDDALGITQPELPAQSVTVVGADGGSTTVEEPENSDDGLAVVEPTIETPVDVQTVESLRRIMSLEDDMDDDMDDDGSTVEVNVDNGDQDTSATFDGDAVTIEPNSDDDNVDSDIDVDNDTDVDTDADADNDADADAGTENWAGLWG